MFDPYRMIVINTILSTVVLMYFTLYTLVFKKKLNYLYLLIILSLLPLVSILRKGTYESGALSEFVKIAYSFYENLQVGILIPQWSSTRMGGYGAPLYEFMYTLPYYIISFLHFLGFSFINSVKILLGLSYVFSGITFFIWIKEEFNERIAFFSSLLYLFAPYHLVNMHFRNDIGEMLSFMILPFNLFCIKKLTTIRTFNWVLITGISLVLLIIAHQTIALVGFPFICLYFFYLLYPNFKKKSKPFFYFLIAITVGLLLSFFYWFPILIEKQFIVYSKFSKIPFLTLQDLLYSPYRYGFLFQGPEGELAFLIGYIHLSVCFISLIFLRKVFQKKEKEYVGFFLICFFFFTFMTLPYSEFLWNTIPLIKNFQFTYRLLVLISFCSSIVGGILFSKIKNNSIVSLLCILVIAITILNWGNRKTIPEINDSYLIDELINKEVLNDLTKPIWANYNPEEIKNVHSIPLEVLEGKMEVKKIQKNPIYHEYILNILTPSLLKENTFYFPGWRVKLNGKNYPFNYNYPHFRGIITFNVQPGLYKLEVYYEDTFVRKMSKIISGICFITLFICLSFLFVKKRFI